MQTKSILSIFSVSVYLLGLFGYSQLHSPSYAQTNVPVAAVSVTSPVALVDTTDIVAGAQRLAQEQRAQPVPVQPRLGDRVIVNTIQSFNRTISSREANQLACLIETTARRYDVDPLLVTALVSQESAFYADAVSPVGAIGYGQLMPYTADDLGVNPHDPAQNLDGCVKYLAQNLDYWANSSDPIGLALASYNAGPGAVESYGGVPPYEETQNYVYIISDRYEQLHSRDMAYKAGNSNFG